MTQKERMTAGLIYDPMAPEILAEQIPCLEKLQEFNRLGPGDFEKKQAFMRENFPQLSERREDNYIMGQSMGGYGSLKTALTFPERYQAIGTIERITTTLSEVLGRPVKGYSYQDVLDELNTMESRKLAERDYAGVQKVLAAKFAIAQILKGGEANGSE